MTPASPQPNEPKAKFPVWFAAVPGLVIATIFVGRALVQTGGAASAITGDTSTHSKALSCVETYSITLGNSEFYVPEGQQFVPRKNVEISTVLSGMVRSDCAEPLKSVRIPIDVRDESGKQGSGTVTVQGLSPGEAKPFSHAWMGRITSYEIGKIR